MASPTLVNGQITDFTESASSELHDNGVNGQITDAVEEPESVNDEEDPK